MWATIGEEIFMDFIVALIIKIRELSSKVSGNGSYFIVNVSLTHIEILLLYCITKYLTAKKGTKEVGVRHCSMHDSSKSARLGPGTSHTTNCILLLRQAINLA